MLATAHGAACGRPDFNAFGYIERHPSNILTSASFTLPPRKSWLQRMFEQIIRIVMQEGRP